MPNTDPFEHYQTEDATGGCCAISAGIAGMAVIVILTIIALFIITRPGF